MAALVYLNGRITPPEEARVSVFDRGFLFGDGVYETGKSVERCFLYLEEHWARLRRSAGKLQIDLPWPDAELKEGLYATARQFGKPDVYFRTIVTRGQVERVGLEIGARSAPTLVHIIQDLPAPKTGGVKLLTSQVRRNSAAAQDPNIKTSNYLNSLLALHDVRARGGEDAILCDREGRVTEGTTFSIFGVTRDGRLITPALEVGILDSITRRHVLSLARQSLLVAEGYFELPAFLDCAEVFAAASVRGILPVREWDGMVFPAPGPVSTALQKLLADDIAAYVKRHERF
jgi:branched-subunit amino acid aminotransferase/4-amino-4-deoxychorismate lyase